MWKLKVNRKLDNITIIPVVRNAFQLEAICTIFKFSLMESKWVCDT